MSSADIASRQDQRAQYQRRTPRVDDYKSECPRRRGRRINTVAFDSIGQHFWCDFHAFPMRQSDDCLASSWRGFRDTQLQERKGAQAQVPDRRDQARSAQPRRCVHRGPDGPTRRFRRSRARARHRPVHPAHLRRARRKGAGDDLGRAKEALARAKAKGIAAWQPAPPRGPRQGDRQHEGCRRSVRRQRPAADPAAQSRGQEPARDRRHPERPRRADGARRELGGDTDRRCPQALRIAGDVSSRIARRLQRAVSRAKRGPTPAWNGGPSLQVQDSVWRSSCSSLTLGTQATCSVIDCPP